VDKSLEIHFTAPVEETEKSAKRGKLIDESLYEREVAMD
jgi:hypothetical protein